MQALSREETLIFKELYSKDLKILVMECNKPPSPNTAPLKSKCGTSLEALRHCENSAI